MANSTWQYSSGKAATCLLTLSVLLSPVYVCAQDKQTAPTLATGASTLPTAGALTDLTRSTMSLVSDGSQSGNFTGLYAQFSPAVQKNVDQTKLNEALASFRERKIDLSGIATTEPIFYQPPQIDQQGILHLTGVFPTQPRMVRFNLGYRQIDGKWLLELFTVDTPTAKELEAATKAQQTTPAAVQKNAGQTPSKSTGNTAKKDTPSADSQTKKSVALTQPATSALDVSTDPPTTTKW